MRKDKQIKKLGYGVAIHFNEYNNLFEVYKIGSYHPGSPNIDKKSQKVSRDKSLKKAIKEYKNISLEAKTF